MKRTVLRLFLFFALCSISLIITTNNFDCAEKFRKNGEHEKAIEYYAKVLEETPNHPAAQFYYATELFLCNHYETSEKAFHKLVTSYPNCPQAHFNYGLLLQQTGNINDAIAHYKIVSTLNPHHTKALLNLAHIYEEQNDRDAALHYYQLIDEKTFDMNMSIGTIFQKQQSYETALTYFCSAANQCPKHYESMMLVCNALLTLGNHFFSQRQPEQALTAFRQMLTISKNITSAHHNIGFTLAELCGNFHDAIDAYQQALRINPQLIETTFCLSLSLLATGNLTEGWHCYESRWQRFTHHDKRPRNFNYPLPKQWDGSDPRGKRICIRAEQGLGDTLQFIRYAQLLKEKGATVIAEVQKSLVCLLSYCNYLDEIIPIGTPLPEFDYQVPIMTLPLLFKTTLDSIPASIPYLYAHESLVAFWYDNLQNNNALKIGICWYGDAAHGQEKFMPLSYFVQLTQLNNIKLYSLQKITGLEQLDLLPEKNIIHQFNTDFDELHGRFMDTAAVIKNLDLVITVDTSIAHLAGALGTHVWLVLPFPAEWRWLTDRNDSPWYPTMRLFRKQYGHSWQSVIDDIISELKQFNTKKIVL